MSANAYFDSHYNTQNSRIEIGTCACDPAHTVFAELRFPAKGIVVLCEAKNPLKWAEVVSVKDEFRDLDGQPGKKAVPKKRSVSAFLRLCHGRFVAKLEEQPDVTSVIHVRTRSSLSAHEEQTGDDATTGDESNDGILPDEVESPPDSPTATGPRPLAKKKPSAATTMPIFFYRASTMAVSVFNMWHISRTFLYYGAIIAIDAFALYKAWQSADGSRIWQVVINTVGDLLPASLRGAAQNLQQSLGIKVSNDPIPVSFNIPRSVISSAAESLHEYMGKGSVPCGEPSEDESERELKEGGKKGNGRGK